MTHSHRDGALALFLKYRAEQSSDSFYNGAIWHYLPFFLEDKRLWAYAGWDLAPQADKKEELVEHLAKSSAFFASCYERREPLALAWGRQLGRDSAELHFLTARRKPELVARAGAMLLRLLGKRYKSLICLVPRPFYGARALAERLGFLRLASLGGACFLAARGRYVDGLLYVWQGEECW